MRYDCPRRSLRYKPIRHCPRRLGNNDLVLVAITMGMFVRVVQLPLLNLGLCCTAKAAVGRSARAN